MANEWQRLWDLLENRLTEARAGYLDELAAANMPADLDTVKADTPYIHDQAINSPAANSIADIVDTIKGLVDTAEAGGACTYLDAGGEQTVYEDAATTRRRISFDIDLNAMTQNGIARVYRKVDGVNYRVWMEHSFNAAGNEKVWTITEALTNQAFKITYQESGDEGADRDIPYNVVTQAVE